MTTQRTQTRRFFSPGKLLFLVATLLFLYVIVPRLGNFSQSFTALKHAHWAYTITAVAGLLLTYPIAAGTYVFLAQKPLRYPNTIWVQVASAFTTRLLPAGFGGLALNVQYLRKMHHTMPQAVAVAGANNTLGAIGHLLVLGVLLLISRNNMQLPDVHLPNTPLFWLILSGIIVLLAVVLLMFRTLRMQTVVFITTVGRHLAYYRHAPGKLSLALLCSMALTTSYIFIFYCAGHALGLSYAFLPFALVFTGGMVASSATPTPGGLVGAEAGLTAGLVAYGADPSQALAAVLLYRFITYWFPLLPGLGVFLATRRLYL
jgi:uncharacterized membrane protein YbhN (UPF0104 family)